MNRMRQLREERKITMKEAAAQLGMPYTTYVNYEKGVREPNSETLIQIASFYGSTIDYLLGRVDTPIHNLHAPNVTDGELNKDPSSEAQKIAKAYDKAKPKEKHMVRLTLSEYLDDEVIELANVARTGANITVTETLGEHEARRAATLHDIETLEDTKLP